MPLIVTHQLSGLGIELNTTTSATTIRAWVDTLRVTRRESPLGSIHSHMFCLRLLSGPTQGVSRRSSTRADRNAKHWQRRLTTSGVTLRMARTLSHSIHRICRSCPLIRALRTGQVSRVISFSLTSIRRILSVGSKSMRTSVDAVLTALMQAERPKPTQVERPLLRRWGLAPWAQLALQFVLSSRRRVLCLHLAS